MTDAREKAAHGSLGSHPHSDRPNWRLAETIEEYFSNCHEGLETYSERRAAKLLGIQRTALWRWKLMAELPDDLSDRLRASGVRGTKALAQVALALRRGVNDLAEVEVCPHCAGVLRVRELVNVKAREVVNRWLADQEQNGHHHDEDAVSSIVAQRKP